MIKVYVMQTCPDCAQIKKVAETDNRFQIIDIGEHVKNLKEFLRLRDSRSEFADVKTSGSVGIPCFLMEDGSIQFEMEELQLPEVDYAEGSACRIDGTGC
jgi:glutaredoxin-related protein